LQKKHGDSSAEKKIRIAVNGQQPKQQQDGLSRSQARENLERFY
jgi:hypothetical protein